MGFLDSLTIKQKLAVGYGTILLLMVILTAIGIKDVIFIDKTLAQITDVNSVKQRYAINYRGSVHDRAIAIRDIALARSPAEINEFEREIRNLAKFYADSESKMNAMMRSDTPFTQRERVILDKIQSAKNTTEPLITRILEAKRSGQDVSQSVLDEARPAFITWLATVNEFIDYQEKENQLATPEARDVAGGFAQFMVVATIFAVLLSIFVGLLIAKSIKEALGGEVNTAKNVLSSIATGNLSQTVTTDYPNSMLANLSNMQTTLAQIVGKIVTAANELSSQTQTVSKGSDDILQVAQNQAALTQQTSANLDSLRHSINHVSDIAMRTEENSALTVEFADKGRTAINLSSEEMEKISVTVNATVEQVKKLEENTEQIGGIANVISGISEQTNLLALNAAIEAARAGESGRGFAVVADEVRQLAQRTGEATAQIESMIGEIQKETSASVQAMEQTQPQVEKGKALITEATELLHKIDDQASDSLNRVREVVQASSDQVSSIESATTAMSDIDNMSGHAIEVIDINRQATQTLNSLSSDLKEAIGFFDVRK